MESLRRSRGFTVIELLVVVIIVCILALFVALAYSGVQAKNRNNERQSDIDLVQGQLEAYYAETNTYPTLANLSNPTWRSQNLKHLSDANVQDPHWSEAVAGCTANSKPVLAATPTANCYSYQVTGTDGSMCDNAKVPCAHYTLTAVLEGGGEKYVKSSLN